MKLHLPTKLRTALMGLAAAAAPFALTVATASSVAVFAGVAQAEDLALSGNQQNVGANTRYENVTVSGTELSTIAFTSTNKNLIIDSLSIAEGARLTINAPTCDLVVVDALSGAGDLTLNRANTDSNWGYALTLKGDNSDYTGTIRLINHSAYNATQVYLMEENSARNAVVNLGYYTTLGVSTGTARIAGLTGTDSHAAVISFTNPNATQSADGLGTNSGNCYNQNTSRDTNDGTLRTLVLNGSGEYSYAGRIGSETNANKLNLTVELGEGGKQTLSGTNYINMLTVTSGDLVLSGTTVLKDRATGTLTVQDGTLTIRPADNDANGSSTAAFGHVKVLQGGTLVLNKKDLAGWNNKNSASIYLKGEGDNVATLQLNDRQTTSIDITLAGSARIESGVTGTGDNSVALDMFGGTIIATGTNNEINAIISTRKNITLEVGGGDTGAATDTLTVNGQFYTRNSDNQETGLVTKTGAGKLVLGSDSNAFRGGITVSAGELELAAGSVSTIATGKTLSVASGAVLTIEGQLNLADATLSIADGATVALRSMLSLSGATLSNSGTIDMQEGAIIDFGVYDGTITVGNMTGFSQEKVYGLGGRKTATYADGVITITGSIGNIVWNGTADSHVWSTATDNNDWLSGSNADHFVDWDNVTFDTLAEGVSSTVTVTETVAVTSITVNDAYTFEMQADNTFTDIAGSGTFTKAGAATLTLGQTPTANLAVAGGTVVLTQAFGGTADAHNIKLEGGTLAVSLATGAYGTQLTLDGTSTGGAVEVQQGVLRVDNGNASELGAAGIVLNDGTGITFASSADITSTVANNIQVKGGTVTLRTFGDAGNTATNVITGAISGSGTLSKVDGGQLTISGDMSGFTGAVSMEANASNRLVFNTSATLTGLDMGNNTTLTVSGTGHTLTIGSTPVDLDTMGDGVTVSTDGQTRHINAGAGATLHDNRYLWLNGGTLNIGGGGTVEVFGISLSCNNGRVSTINIAADTTLHIFGTANSTVHGNEAAFSISHWNAANRINVLGTLISDADIVAVAATTAAVDIKDGGKLVMANGLIAKHRDGGAVSVINVEAGGTLSVGDAGERTSDDGALQVNMAAGSTIEAYAADSVVKDTLTLGTGEGSVNFLAAAGKTLTIQSLSGDLGVDVQGGGTVALDGATVAGAVSVEEGSTLTLNGNVTISKTILSGGTVRLAEGAQLTLADTTGLTVDGNATYSEGQNGYANASFIIVGGAGQVENLGSVTLNGETYEITEHAGNHVVMVEGTAGTYYVNGGTVVYGDADNDAANSATTGILLNGGTLEIQQQSLAEGVGITLSTDGTVNLGEQASLSSGQVALSGHTLTLTGSGKYTHQTADGDFSLNAGYGFSNWSGTVELEAKSSQMNLNMASGTSYEGTMVLNFGNHVLIGTNNADSASIFGAGTHLVLNAGTEAHALIINSQYANNRNLTLASLASGVDSNGNYVVSYIRGDYDTGASRYIKVQQNKDTTFAGIFMNSSSNRGLGLIKEGTGNLTLTGANASTTDLQVNGGTLTFAGNGSWAGAITVGNGGTLAYDGGEKSLANVTLNNGAHLKVQSGTVTLDKAMTVSRSNGNINLGSGEVKGTLKLLTGGSLEYDNLTITGVEGAESSISAAGGTELSLYQEGLSASNIQIADATSGRIIRSALSNVAYTNTAGGAVMQEKDKTFSALSLAGALTVETNVTLNGNNSLNDVTISGDKASLTIGGRTSASSTTLNTASLTIAYGAIYTTGNETITALLENTAAVISGTGLVSVATAGITYANANITVNTNEDLTTAATLSNSKLTVSGGGSVQTEVAADSTNSFNATGGSVSVNTGTSGTTQVETLTVGSGNEASFATESGDDVTIIVEDTAVVAGTVSANVTVGKEDSADTATFTAREGATVNGCLEITGTGTATFIGNSTVRDGVTVGGTATLEAGATVTADVTVASNSQTSATFTANSGSTVGGNLTVTDTGTLVINSAQTENTSALEVGGILELKADSVLNLSDLVTDLGITQQETDQTFVIASAQNFSIDSAAKVLGLEDFSWTLTNIAGEVLLSSSGTAGADTESPAMFSMRRAARSTMDNLTLTILGLTETPDTLTATATNTSYINGTLNIDVAEAEALASLVGKDVSVTVGSEAWAAIVEAMNGEVYQNATIMLNGESLGQFSSVSFNGYTGEPSGEYFVAYIPEPATATLSLLALAALAARRRRK